MQAVKILLTVLCLLGLITPAIAGGDQDTIARVESKVTKHVQSYFLTRPAGGAPAQPYQVLVDITVTRPVEDRPGRYLTTGKATVVYIDGGANYAAAFEVTTEIDSEGLITITDTKSRRVT